MERMLNMSGNTGALDAKTIRIGSKAVIRPRALEAPPIPRTKKPIATPRPQERERSKTLANKAFSEAKSVPGVSVFAIFGTLFVSVLMVFVVLAQINYNETANESVRLSAELRALEEQHRALEFAFESSFDIREVERIAKDELGMSRPDSAQIITITAAPRDTAIVIIGEDDSGGQGFADFLKSLIDYFR